MSRLMLVLLTMWSRNALTSVSVVFTATCERKTCLHQYRCLTLPIAKARLHHALKSQTNIS